MPRLLFVVTEDWYFCSHRLPLAEAARRAGYEVAVACRVARHGGEIRERGIGLFPWPVSRRSRQPLRELAAVLRLVRICRSWRPDIVHHVAMKPVIYGSIAARATRVPGVVNALAGMGFLFIARGRRARLARALVARAFRLLFRAPNSRVLLQNPDDRDLLVRTGVVAAERVALIRGSGVDPARFRPGPEPGPPVVVLLASRMLWDKGVGEFVAAAGRLRRAGCTARFVLVGGTDCENPAAIPPERLAAWQRQGVVEWWGRRDDMPEVFAQAHVACLPSYREGLPKVLLEAAACGLPLVATDVPGCREIVRQGETGLLVPPRDPDGLASALLRLVDDRELRRSLGARARAVVEAEFTIDRIAAQTLRLYAGLLPGRPAGPREGRR